MDLGRPFKRFLHDLLSETFAFDARIWRTIPLLVTKPGVLAAEYVAGRRARFVPPLRFYVFLGAAFFTVLVLTGGGPMRFSATTDAEGTVFESAVGVDLGDTGATPGTVDPGEARLVRAAEDVEGINAVVVATLSYAHFLLLPVLAGFLKVLWRRRWYVEHLVFAMYMGSFGLLVGIVVTGFYGLAGNPDPPGLTARVAVQVWGILVLVMAYRALRDMYSDSRPRTVAKLGALAFASFFTTAMVVFGIFATSLWFVYQYTPS